MTTKHPSPKPKPRSQNFSRSRRRRFAARLNLVWTVDVVRHSVAEVRRPRQSRGLRLRSPAGINAAASGRQRRHDYVGSVDRLGLYRGNVRLAEFGHVAALTADADLSAQQWAKIDAGHRGDECDGLVIRVREAANGGALGRCDRTAVSFPTASYRDVAPASATPLGAPLVANGSVGPVVMPVS